MLDKNVPKQIKGGLRKSVRTAGMVLGGTAIVAVLIGWTAFLLWLAGEAVIAAVHWL